MKTLQDTLATRVEDDDPFAHLQVRSTWGFDAIIAPEPSADYIDAIDMMRGNDRAPAESGDESRSALAQAMMLASDPDAHRALSLDMVLPPEPQVEHVLDPSTGLMRAVEDVGLEEHLTVLEADPYEAMLPSLWDESMAAVARLIRADQPVDIVISPMLPPDGNMDDPHLQQLRTLKALAVQEGLTAEDEVFLHQPTIVLERVGRRAALIAQHFEHASAHITLGEWASAWRHTCRALDYFFAQQPDRPGATIKRRDWARPQPPSPPAYRQAPLDRYLTALSDAAELQQAADERAERIAEREHNKTRTRFRNPVYVDAPPVWLLADFEQWRRRSSKTWACSFGWYRKNVAGTPRGKPVRRLVKDPGVQPSTRPAEHWLPPVPPPAPPRRPAPRRSDRQRMILSDHRQLQATMVHCWHYLGTKYNCPQALGSLFGRFYLR